MYNLTQLQNVENVGDLVLTANSYTASTIPVIGALSIALFVIMLSILMKYGFIRAMLTSSYVMFTITAILVWGGYLAFYYPAFFLALLGFTFLYSIFGDKS